ncbi:MAG: DNA adenine methylase, partial [Nitrososphaerota archaeon]
VLFAKPPSQVEVINDLDESMVNLYRVLKDEGGYKELVHRLRYTLYSRAEFVRALDMVRASDEYTDVDRAWARMVMALQGFAGKADGRGDGGRNMNGSKSPIACMRKPEHLYFFHERLRNVHISRMDGIEFIKKWDSVDTLFYIDPPYILSTRKSKKIYRYEQPDEYHERLVNMLLGIQGKAMVSHYLHPIYQELEKAGYVRYEFRALAHMVGFVRTYKGYGKSGGVRPERLECLWVKSDI